MYVRVGIVMTSPDDCIAAILIAISNRGPRLATRRGGLHACGHTVIEPPAFRSGGRSDCPTTDWSTVGMKARVPDPRLTFGDDAGGSFRLWRLSHLRQEMGPPRIAMASRFRGGPFAATRYLRP